MEPAKTACEIESNKDCVEQKLSDLKKLENDISNLKQDCLQVKSFSTDVRLIFSDSKQEQAATACEERPRAENRITELSCEVDTMKRIINDIRLELVNIKDLIE